MTTQIFDFLNNLEWGGLSAKTQERAKLSLIDLIGVGFSARETELARIVTRHSQQSFGGTKPFLFARGDASATGVALAGGMTIDAIDGHDGWNRGKGHVGCGLFPALYALAPEGLNGADFLTSIVAGYELGTRLSVTLHETVPDYHTSGAWVAVAVALAGGHLAGLRGDALAHAAGIAEYHGPRSQMMRCIDHPTMVKDGSGWGAMTGVSAVELARLGFTGAPALTLAGPHWADLGTTWHMDEQYYKNYPVCRWAQPPVEACLALQRRHGFNSADIAQIQITTFHESTRLATRAPQTTEEAQYSTAYPVALALAHGKLGPGEVQGDMLFDPQVLRLARCTNMDEDDHANALFPRRRIASARITLRNGKRLECDWHDAVWDPLQPASVADIEAKFRDYAMPAVGKERAEKIVDCVMALDNAPAAALFDLITE
ncbi:MAG: MmgE/PrpD family protein [Pseudomonadota bacterium]